MTKDTYAIGGLKRKRAELAGKIDRHQAELVTLLTDLNAIDTALRIFDPDIELTEIVMKPLPPRNGAARGQMTMLALTILREATAPMRTEDINEELMKRRGLSISDKPLKRMMLERLHSCLRNHRKRGRIRSIKKAKFSVWEIAK